MTLLLNWCCNIPVFNSRSKINNILWWQISTCTGIYIKMKIKTQEYCMFILKHCCSSAGNLPIILLRSLKKMKSAWGLLFSFPVFKILWHQLAIKGFVRFLVLSIIGVVGCKVWWIWCVYRSNIPWFIHIIYNIIGISLVVGGLCVLFTVLTCFMLPLTIWSILHVKSKWP